MKEFTLKDLAEYIVYLSFKNGNSATNFALQKMLYFLHYLFLHDRNQKLTNDAVFEAWRYGPVAREIYFEYKIYSGFLIIPTEEPKLYKSISEYVGSTYENLLRKWSEMIPIELGILSNEKGDAWDLIYSKSTNKEIIPDKLIKNHISQKTRKALYIE